MKTIKKYVNIKGAVPELSKWPLEVKNLNSTPRHVTGSHLRRAESERQRSLGPLPDYGIGATCYADVQAAVRFAALRGVRKSVIATGHDQLRYKIVGSGRIIDISLLQGARVSASSTPTAEGVQNAEVDGSLETTTP
ncbi:putative FAD-binding PCMH-type domain-containing protein [Seiridium cardinale]|uniref:FAD-binding PCMH-type domain-containing protein n=1 Tax=Seiridium cardinale TaxID=138064 RepID=A0ABR2X810_9PEZI